MVDRDQRRVAFRMAPLSSDIVVVVFVAVVLVVAIGSLFYVFCLLLFVGCCSG